MESEEKKTGAQSLSEQAEAFRQTVRSIERLLERKLKPAQWRQALVQVERSIDHYFQDQAAQVSIPGTEREAKRPNGGDPATVQRDLYAPDTRE